MDAAVISSMENLDMDAELSFPSPSRDQEDEDLAASLIARYQNSSLEDHHRLMEAVGTTAQFLKDQGIPQTPVAYFGATLSSLDRFSRDPTSALDPFTSAFLAFLSVILPKVPPAVIRNTGDSVCETLVRILGFQALPVGGVKAGLKCASNLIVVGEKGNWEKISPIYGVILGFVTDHRPKVRKQSHSCLYDVLRSFQGLPVLVLASEGVKNIFERFLLLAGGSNSASATAVDGPSWATEVLYILNALKDCLPLMSLEYTSAILKYCKSLLDLRLSIVTRNIMEILQAFCFSSTSEVASELLLDLLCSLALSIGEKENSGDEMASTARLLHVGIKKAYHLNRQICIVKLPIIFNALGEVLASEHEEAVFAATEALKGLISSCIDEGLVRQGIEQINLNLEGGMRKSGPTIIEKICAIMEDFLGYRYNAVWDMSFQVISAAFNQLGESSSHLMAGTIRSLADLQNLPSEDFSDKKQLHECVGSALGAMGPQILLSLLPLNLDAEDVSDANVWLLPILKHYTVGAHLEFFLKNILDMVRLLQHKSLKLEKEGRIFSARSFEGVVYSLWSLLPAFCNYPIDTSSSFKDLQTVLCDTLPQKPDLHGIICSSLQILIRQNRSILEENRVMLDDELSNAERKAKEYYTPQVAGDNLNAIRSFSSKFLTVLSATFKASPKDNGGCLQSTIRDFSSISEKKVVKKHFKKVMLELLRVTQKVNEGKQSDKISSMQIDSSSDEASLSNARALLLDLAVSLLPGLDKEEIDVLFSAIKSAFQDKEGLMQKKAYKTLSIILKECDEFLSSKVDELIALMIEATNSCHFSAKRHRLDSLYYLIVHVSKEDIWEPRKRDGISAFLTEIMLALKEANKKTRNRAYELLVKIGHACGDEDKGGKKENLLQFFNMITGGLAGEKPHMISAAIKGIARLAYEFSDLVSAAYSFLPSSFLLLQRKNREIIKATLGLIKVLVAKSNADGLQMHLRAMVEGLLKWQDDTKNHFKAKVKLLLEMLVRKCGLDAVKAVMPEDHMKLLTNIRKIKERKERKARSEDNSESLHTRTSISRHSRWNHTRIFSDFEDEDRDDDSDPEDIRANTIPGRGTKASLPVSRSVRKQKAAKSLLEDLLDQPEDDPLDLLDRQRTRSALQSSTLLKRKLESSDDPEVDPEGRLIVRVDGQWPRKTKNLSSELDSDTKSQASNRSSAKSSRALKKRQRTTDSGWAYTGSEYTSRKGSGDAKKKDKLDPYAYWPLDRKLLNRRAEHKAVARKGMASVMKVAKQFEGKSAKSALAAKGIKLKKKHKKGNKGR